MQDKPGRLKLLWRMQFFLMRIVLPGIFIFSGCDTALGNGLTESGTGSDSGKLEAGGSGDSGNPFLGKDWINDEGFIYTFGIDGTIFVEHHCGLEFDNQFSYLIWKNILVIYGTEMDNTDTLKAGTMAAQEDSIIFATTAGETITYTLAEDGLEPPETGLALDNVFIGTWLAGDGLCTFGADGTLVQTAAGKSSAYSYLTRKDRLVTLSREAEPLLKEYCFEKNGDTITVNPVGGGNPLIYTPYGR
jgi:hypothetical protein